MAQESWKCDQDETGCQPPEGPILCANNCGFFGSKATMNLCSKCYRDVVLSQTKVSTAKNALEQLPLLINNTTSNNSSTGAVPPAVAAAAAATTTATTIAASGTTATVAMEESVVVVEEDKTQLPQAVSSTAAAAALDVDGGGGEEATPAAAADASGSGSRPPNRCNACNKRVGLTGFSCRCGNVYCSLHRYSDKHNCTYDYKRVGRDAIAKANPVIKADKIDKI